MTAPTIIRWEPPPPASPESRAAQTRWDRRNSPWADVAAELQRHPGEWAVITETGNRARAGYIAWAIRRGAQGGFEPVGEYDAVARRTGDGRWAVHAVFVGGETA